MRFAKLIHPKPSCTRAVLAFNQLWKTKAINLGDEHPGGVFMGSAPDEVEDLVYSR